MHFRWFSRKLQISCAEVVLFLLSWVENKKNYSLSSKPSQGLLQGFVSIKNTGEIQFRSLGENECAVRIVISYQLPEVLLPIADLLKPTVDGILDGYMKNFETVAIAEQEKLQQQMESNQVE